MAPEFYADTYPLVATQLPPTVDDAAVLRLDAFCRELWAREKQFALISMSNPGRQLDVVQRRRLTEWANEPSVRAQTARWCVGTASVIESGLMRGTLTAVLWVWKPPMPLKPAANLDVAIDFCLEQLRANDVPLGQDPADVRARLHAAFDPAAQVGASF